jgi:hypothetical protein
MAEQSLTEVPSNTLVAIYAEAMFVTPNADSAARSMDKVNNRMASAPSAIVIKNEDATVTRHATFRIFVHTDIFEYVSSETGWTRVANSTLCKNALDESFPETMR